MATVVVLVQNSSHMQPKTKSGKVLSSFVSSQPIFFARLWMLAHLFFTIISWYIMSPKPVHLPCFCSRGLCADEVVIVGSDGKAGFPTSCSDKIIWPNR